MYIFFSNTLEKTKTNLEQLKLCVAKLETVKEQPEKKLSLCKDITGDIQFWDRCIDEIHRLKNVVDKLQIQMTNAGNIIDLKLYNLRLLISAFAFIYFNTHVFSDRS